MKLYSGTLALLMVVLIPSFVCASECVMDFECFYPFEYCQKEGGDCYGPGTCAPIPTGTGCLQVWIPVCGCNGVTYSNNCYAHIAGVNVSYGMACGSAALSVNDVAGAESDAEVSFTVSIDRSPESSQTISVDYATLDGTAVGGSDFQAVAGTLVFDLATPSITVTVPLVDDLVYEPLETFRLLLSNVSPGAEIRDVLGVATIVDDDEPYLSVASMGPAPGNTSLVRVFDTSWMEVHSFAAFDAETVGYGARVASGDVDGDGLDEIVVAKGEGLTNNSEVKVFRFDGTPLSGANFVAFSTAYFNGARVATGDIDGDGKDEIVVGAAVNQSLIRVFSYDPDEETISDTGLMFHGFSGSLDGVNVAAADIDGNGLSEILVASGPDKDAVPDIRVWGVDTSGGMGHWVEQPHPGFAPPPGGILTNATGYGASVAAAAGRIAVASGADAGTLEVYDETGALVCSASGFEYSTRLSSGVEVSIGDSDNDGTNEIVVTLGSCAMSDTEVLTFDSTTCASEGTPVSELFPGSLYGARMTMRRTP